MTHVLHLPALKDNYIWALMNPETKRLLIIDPGEAKPVLSFIHAHQASLSGILITHHHPDHCQGVSEILDTYPTVPVYYPSPQNLSPLFFKLEKEAKPFELLPVPVPGHTLDHTAYFNPSFRWLFTGDTLFTGGCGRVFEGTTAQLYQSLQKLLVYPDDTKIYCGHEYTEKNLAFAHTIEPDNAALNQRIEKVKKLRQKNLPTVPAFLKEEKETNPFLRCHLHSVQIRVEQLTGQAFSNPVETFTALRHLKDQF